MNSLRSLPRTAMIMASIATLSPLATMPICSGAYAGQADKSAAQLDKTRSLAESQHEIVILLIKQKEFEQALREANKIFDMKWPQDQEPTLLRELLLFADQFLHSGQAATGVRLLETNLKSFKNPVSQASIWKEKGYLYKNLGEDKRALECFREAQRLEK